MFHSEEQALTEAPAEPAAPAQAKRPPAKARIIMCARRMSQTKFSVFSPAARIRAGRLIRRGGDTRRVDGTEVGVLKEASEVIIRAFGDAWQHPKTAKSSVISRRGRHRVANKSFLLR